MGVLLIRHTQPDIAPGYCYGQTDIDLPPDAEQDFAKVRDALLHTPLADPPRLVTSPLRRCRHLAAWLSAALDWPLSVDARLQEMHFGAWEGQAWDDIPREQLDAWAGDLWRARPHGGESVTQLKTRVAAAIAEYEARRGAHILVTHAGVIKVALAAAMGAQALDWSHPIAFGAVISLHNQYERINR